MPIQSRDQVIGRSLAKVARYELKLNTVVDPCETAGHRRSV